MASAQLMEEELQQSVMVSEEDAEYDEDGENGDFVEASVAAPAVDGNDIETSADDDGGDEHLDDDEEEQEDEGASLHSGEDDEDAEGEDDADFVDADGEEDDDATVQVISRTAIPSLEDEDGEGEEEEEDVEGVGAVKIKPGETDEESEIEASQVPSDEDSDGGAEWEDAVGNEDEDEESEAAATNICMFCKQDEDHDPSEEFEAYLTCSGCGENAHQQCARDNKALRDNQPIEDWRCLDCAADFSDVDSVGEGPVANGITDAELSPGARRATAPKVARDLLPSQRGAVKPDSHSVFNQLVLDEDPMDGSRVLRKRKTSSAEADEHVMSLRKRRKTEDEESAEGTNGLEESARPHSSRSLRLKISTNAPSTVVRKSRTSLVMRFRVNPSGLKSLLSQKPKPKKKEAQRSSTARTPRPGTARSATLLDADIPAPFVSTNYSQPFYSFFDKDLDELKGKPYGGILTEAEADTSKTLPTNDDRRGFDEAKQKAEEEWRQRLLAMQAELDVPVKKTKKVAGPASQIECIEFGGWEIDTWYAAPYPEEYSRNRVLYICEFCLKYMNSDYVAWRHKLKCPAKHPPGDEIYRAGSVSVFEVDGRKNPVYCQNLCLLAKLFLGSKTLYYDVEPFLFYVLCEYDDLGYHFVGYFSKEKRATSQNNVSCILTLPIHQRKGYGNLLIDFSYLLTRVEEKTGSPEKPLSDMGLVSYRNYWRLIMCRYLLDHVPDNRMERRGLSIKQISDDTGLTADDVVSALEGLRCLVRDPQTGLYAFRVDLTYCREYVAKWESKKYVQLNPNALTWTPYLMGRSNAANFELGPAMHAIAPREDEEEHKVAEAVAEALPNGEVNVLYATANGVDHQPNMDVDSTVVESTEPNETAVDPADDSDEKPLENGVAMDDEALDEDSDPMVAGSPEDEWISVYQDIPPSRFAIFPPVNGSRRPDRPRPSIARPPISRTTSISTPKIRHPTSASRRSTTSKPRSSGSRRKTGGTGRGPGRWPKGTKKSDYGNADSGPGLPPAWVAERARNAAVTAVKKEVGTVGAKLDSDTEDTVQVKAVDVKERRNGLLTMGNGNGNGNGKSPRSTRASSSADADISMKDVDVDLE